MWPTRKISSLSAKAEVRIPSSGGADVRDGRCDDDLCSRAGDVGGQRWNRSAAGGGFLIGSDPFGLFWSLTGGLGYGLGGWLSVLGNESELTRVAGGIQLHFRFLAGG